MECDWVSKRAHLRALLRQHPDWSVSQLANAVGFARSTVSRWKRRLLAADPTSISVLFSRSRAPHRHPPRVAQAVVDRIIELRLAPPEQLHRTPGPKAILYFLPRDETLHQLGVRLPTSTRTIWRILDQAGLIARATPSQRSPRNPQDLLEEVQVDFKDVGTVTVDPTAPTTKRQHLIEVCNFIYAGSSRLLSAQVHNDFHAETAFDAVIQFLRTYGLPTMLTMDRDVRWVGSAGQRDFPSALQQFLHCVGVIPNVLPPHRPELNCYVERYHRTYKQECLQVFRPSTLEEVCSVTETFVHHYNHERPHQGRSCGNQPPCVAHPSLPNRPRLPAMVDPDAWLTALDGRWYPRHVKRDGRIVVDGPFYYVKAALAGQQVLLRLNATTRCFEVWMREQWIKDLPIKGLRGEPMPLEAYIELMRERAHSEERQRWLQLRRARLHADHSALRRGQCWLRRAGVGRQGSACSFSRLDVWCHDLRVCSAAEADALGVRSRSPHGACTVAPWAFAVSLVLKSGTHATAKGGKQYTHRCKHGRHPARSFHTHHGAESVLSWLWETREKTVVAALASVRLRYWSCATGPLLGLSGRLSGSSTSHPLVCPVHAVLGGCGSASAGRGVASLNATIPF